MGNMAMAAQALEVSARRFPAPSSPHYRDTVLFLDLWRVKCCCTALTAVSTSLEGRQKRKPSVRR